MNKEFGTLALTTTDVRNTVPNEFAMNPPWVLHSLATCVAFLATSAITTAGQTAVPRLQVVEELRLDATSEDFPEISRVFVGPHGQIAMPLLADMQLRIYDSAGRRVGVVGRWGYGPGEFTTIGSLGWRHDTLWVADQQQARTTFISPRHQVLRSERWRGGTVIGVAQGGEVPLFAPQAILRNGDQLGRVRWQPRLEGVSKAESKQAWGVRQSDGLIRPLLRVPTGAAAPWSISTFACCIFGVPFALEPQYATSSDGEYLAELSAPIPTQRSGVFQITLVRVGGDTVFSRQYPYRGEPIPKKAQDSAVAVVVPEPGHLINVPADLPERVRVEARTRMPAWYIMVESVLIGLDRTVWIGFRPTTQGRRYLVLSSRGDPVGELLVPDATRVRQATASQVWVTETDNDGLADVVRYRLIGLACSSARC